MNPNDVTPGSSPAPAPEPVPTPTPAPAPEPTPGSKTPEANHLAALQEERRLRKEAEERARLAEEQLSGRVPSNAVADEWSDEGRAIIETIVKPIQEQVKSLTEQLTLKDLVIKYPALKEKGTEFEEYRKGKPGVSLEDAAKLFISDNNLTPAPVRRKGLEEPRGGDRTPAPTGMSTEDVAHLRKTNYKQYLKLLNEGKIPLDGSN